MASQVTGTSETLPQTFFKPKPTLLSSFQQKPSDSLDQTLQSNGEPLDDQTRAFMEQRFSHDFSNVQIHNDSEAHNSAEQINALAYTSGNQIAFGKGQYQPNTNQGKRLLAHELTHVVQQQHAGKSLQKQSKPDQQQQEAQLRADFLAIRAAADAASPFDAAAKKSIQQKVKQFFKDFAEYHPVKRFDVYEMDYPGKDDFAYQYSNVYSLPETNELAGRLQFIGLPTEAKLFYDRGHTSTSYRLPRQRDDEFYASYTNAALLRIDASSPAKAADSLSILISSFKYLSGEIAKMDITEIAKTRSMGTYGDERVVKSGYWTEWEFYQAMIGRLGFLYGGMQRIIQSQMDIVIKELDSSGEAPSIPIVVNNLDTIAKATLDGVDFIKPAGDLKTFQPAVSLVEVTRTEFTTKGGMHRDFFDTSAQSASVKIEYYDKEQTEGKEKLLPVAVMQNIRKQQLAFLMSFYGLDSKGRKLTGKEHPADLMGASKTFNLFSIDDWRDFLDKKFDDLTQNKKLSNANAFLELIRLIQSYMKAFTIHTPYNIDDFGDNYLTQNFPRALTGQLIHDCGVYALKTAYLLSLIAPKIGLKFQYIILPNHIGLIMTAKDMPVLILHNDDFTVIPMLEQQFDALSKENQQMSLSDKGIKAYEEAKKKKQPGPMFTMDRLKDDWIRETKAQKLQGKTTDEQFIGEYAANLFVPKTDMPFAIQDINAKNFKPQLKITDIKKKMFDEYKSSVKGHPLFIERKPTQFNLRYLSLTVQIKNFNNNILLPYWNGKARQQWLALKTELEKQAKAGDMNKYIDALKKYRDNFDNEATELFKKYDPISSEKLSIHSEIESKSPDPLVRGATVSLGARGLTEEWQNAFNAHLQLLDTRIQNLTNNTETIQNGTDITPAFEKLMNYYP